MSENQPEGSDDLFDEDDPFWLAYTYIDPHKGMYNIEQMTVNRMYHRSLMTVLNRI